MSLAGWHHIAWPVPDLDRSEAWYCAVLQGEVTQRIGYDPRDVAAGRTRQLWIKAGDAIVNLVEGEAVHRPDDMHFFHYAFAPADNDIDHWIEHLRRHDVEVLGPYGHGGAPSISVYFDDPDNYRLEIVFQYADYETARAEALQRGGKLGNPVRPYDWG